MSWETIIIGIILGLVLGLGLAFLFKLVQGKSGKELADEISKQSRRWL